MEEGKKLISKCSKIHRLNYVAKVRYQEQLEALVDSLVRFFIIDMQAQTARDQKETLIKVTRILSAVNKFPIATKNEVPLQPNDENAEEPLIRIDHAVGQIREEPPSYSSSVMQRYESFENPLARNGTQSFGFRDDELVLSGNRHFGTALYDFIAGGDDELNLTAGEEFEIEYEVDGWFYVKKMRPGRDGKMAGLVPVLYVNLS